MDCREAMRRLSARMDGAEERDAAVDAHVEGCADCRAAGRVWQAVREHLQEVRSPAAPGGLTGRVAAGIRNRRTEIGELKSLLRRTAAAAAALLLTSTAATFLFSREAPESGGARRHASAIDSVLTMIVEERLPSLPAEESER